MKLPPPLCKGDKVALIAPASPFSETENLTLSVKALEARGYIPIVFPSCTAQNGYLAGSDELRADDVNRAFADRAIRGIFCMRGGYGTMRILDLLDYGCIRENPKPFVGLSDITALHLAFYQNACLAGLHAPMPFRYPALPQKASSHLTDLLEGKAISVFTEADGLKTLVPGIVESAPVLGGNLSLFASLLSSKYLPDLTGAILFLEEIGEEPYRIDRLLYTLRLAGVFETCAGVLFGGFTDCGESEKILAAIRSTLPENLPCLFGFPAGHLQNNFGFFMGQNACLDAQKATLSFEKTQRIERCL